MSDLRVKQTLSVLSFFRIQFFADGTSENIFIWALLPYTCPFGKAIRRMRSSKQSFTTGQKLLAPIILSVCTLGKYMELKYAII